MSGIYPGFNYNADQLSKFLVSSDLFTIMLKSGEIIHHSPLDKNLFREWLLQHNIEDISLPKKN